MPPDILAHREKMSRRVGESGGMDRASGRIERLQRASESRAAKMAAVSSVGRF